MRRIHRRAEHPLNIAGQLLAGVAFGAGMAWVVLLLVWGAP